MIEERFIELLTRKLTGALTVQENAEFDYLLGENELYPKLYELFIQYWARDDNAQFDDRAIFEKVRSKIHALGDQQFGTEKLTVAAPVTRTFIPAWLSRAAAVMLLVSCTYLGYRLYHTGKAPSSAGNTVKTTPKGVKSIFILSDGTRITLNSDSKLEYPLVFGGNTREVSLSGEAFFDVHKDAVHPFIIHSGKMSIRVLGTAFNVKAYPNEPSSETTLIRGRIEVTLSDRPNKKIVLSPSQKLVINNHTEEKHAGNVNKSSYSAISRPELTTMTYYRQQDTTVMETSWLQNKLVFKDEDFSSLARKMERWYNVDIHFKDEEMKRLRFTGSFEKETANEMLRALRLTESFSYTINDTGIDIGK